jgi:DNA gyrase subunit A
VLLVTSGGYGKRTLISGFRKQLRGGYGLKSFKLTRVRRVLVAGKVVQPGAEIFVTASDGVVIRIATDSISRQQRDATGVRVMNLDGDAEVTAVAIVPQDEDEVNGDA